MLTIAVVFRGSVTIDLSFGFPMQVMCKYSRELFLSNYISRVYIYLRVKRDKHQVPLGPLLRNQNMQAKEGY